VNQRAEFDGFGSRPENKKYSNAPILAYAQMPPPLTKVKQRVCYLTFEAIVIAQPARVPPNWTNTGAASPKPPTDPTAAERADVLRTVTFYMALSLVFIKFAMLQEIQAYVMGFKGYVLYIFGVPAILGVIVSGGIRRAMGGWPAWFWSLFSVWLFICIPFSSWKGDSFRVARGFLLYQFVLLVVISGLVLSWRECRLVVKAIGIAAIVNLIAARLFGAMSGGAERLTLDFGMVANSNDYAAHLLLTVPFLLIFVYNSKSVVLRIGACLVLAGGALIILRTGSRGALVAMGADILFVLWRGSVRQRIVLACLIPLTAAAILPFVPADVLKRIRSFSASGENVSVEAMESSQARSYLLRKAFEYAVEFPLAGVGPGQFSNYEGGHNEVYGKHGMYHSAHNSFILAFAETGVIGGILVLAAYCSTFLLLNRTYRRAKLRPDCKDIQNVAFCLMLAMVGFCVAIAFLNFTYFFYGPALGGLAISVWRAADVEFSRRTNPLVQRPA
jgi:putative inorganic carbon (hco3(-)) transporter